MKPSRYKWLALLCVVALLFAALASPGLISLAALIIPLWVFFALLIRFDAQLAALEPRPLSAAFLPIHAPRPPPYR